MAERKVRGLKDGKPTVQVTDDHVDAEPEALPTAKPAIVKEELMTVASGRGQREQITMAEYRRRQAAAEKSVDEAVAKAPDPAPKTLVQKAAAKLKKKKAPKKKKKAPKKAKAKAETGGNS